MKFFQSFLNNIQNEKNIIINNNIYYNKYFRSYLFKYFKENFNINNYDDKIINNKNNNYINIMYHFLIPYLNKPQKLIKDDNNYYVAVDMLTNTKYICFKDFCILDFDINKNNFKTKDNILDYINNNNILNNISYYRVETERGFHLYLIDRCRLYSELETFYFISQFESDDYYKFYCYMRGFSIRLSIKNNDTYIFKNIKLINKNNNNSIKLKNLFLEHLQFFD